jgi:adenylate kinase family enzyme
LAAIVKRVVVVGCAGAGKTTLAAALAARFRVPHIERDELGELGSDEYRAAVARAVSNEAWIFDGAPYYEESAVYSRADAVVALDYPRRVVMRRVVWRALRRPDPRDWRDPHHPVRWAWSMGRSRGARSPNGNTDPELAYAQMIRLASPAAARSWLTSVR